MDDTDSNTALVDVRTVIHHMFLPPLLEKSVRATSKEIETFRIHPGDLLLTIPAPSAMDDAIMVLEYKGKRLVRKVRKQEGGKLMLQHYDREFVGEVVSVRDVLIIGRCVRLEATL